MNLAGFDAAKIEPSLPRTGPLPAGDYLVEIVHSEEKAVRAGNGMYLELTFQVSEGEHERRKLWQRLNLRNPSDRAVAIAQAELSAICRAVGVLRPNTSSDLHHRPLMVRVVQSNNAVTGEPTNQIKGYFPAAGDASEQSIAAQANQVFGGAAASNVKAKKKDLPF